MSDGSVIIDTSLNDDGLEKGIDKIGGNFNRLKSIATKALGAIGFGTLVKEGVEYNATVEQLQTSFEVMTGSATKATNIVEKLKEIGANTPFEFTGLAETTQLLMNYGFEAEDAIDKMQMLGDISQGSAEKMNRIATAYGQMSSAGKVSLEDIKQMIEAGFNPLQEISQSTGESMASLYDRISKGTISIEEITASMERSTSVGGKYFQSMEKQSQTLNGQWSTLKDNFSNLLGSVLKPLNNFLTNKLLPAVNDFMGMLQEKIDDGSFTKFSNTLKGLMAVIVPLTTAFVTFKASLAISSLIDNLKKSFDALRTSFATLNAVMNANPILLIISLIAGLVAGIIYLWNTNEGFRNAMAEIWNAVKEAVGNVINAIITFFTETVPNAFNDFITTVTDFVNSVIDWFKNLPYNIGKFIGEIIGHIANFGLRLVDFVTKDIPNFINNVVDWFKKLPGRIWEWLQSSLNNVAKWGTDLINKGKEAARNLVDKVVNTIKELPGKMLDIGKNLVQGLWNGITNAGNWLKEQISNFANGIVEGFKNTFGIHSPSLLMNKEVGKYVALGLGEGFTDNIKRVYAKMKSAVDFENQKLSANVTSNQIIKTQLEDNRQATLQSLDDNKEIIVNTTTRLDSKVIARETNKVNARRQLQYGY